MGHLGLLRVYGVSGAIRGHQGAIRGCRGVRVPWELAGSVGT